MNELNELHTMTKNIIRRMNIVNSSDPEKLTPTYIKKILRRSPPYKHINNKRAHVDASTLYSQTLTNNTQRSP